jgi:hypothetical protein
MKRILALAVICTTMVSLALAMNIDLAVSPSQTTTVKDASRAARITATSPQQEERDQPVTDDDLRILLRANELLKNESVWNRKDDRVCDDDERTGKRSLFFAESVH